MPDKGPSEALRRAIESTFAATASSAAGTRDRAAELLDQVVSRGRTELDAASERLGKVESAIRREARKRKP
jgi:polyhydroxyalkanoate synthesis regulator phasin